MIQKLERSRYSECFLCLSFDFRGEEMTRGVLLSEDELPAVTYQKKFIPNVPVNKNPSSPPKAPTSNILLPETKRLSLEVDGTLRVEYHVGHR